MRCKSPFLLWMSLAIVLGSHSSLGQEPSTGELVSLAVSPGALSPGFSPTRNQYWVRVDHSVASVTFTPVAKHAEAAIQVGGTAVRSGQSSPPVPLSVGRTLVTIEVKSRAGDPSSLTKVHVIREHEVPSWVQVRTENPWVPRDSCGELVFDGKMWLFEDILRR